MKTPKKHWFAFHATAAILVSAAALLLSCSKPTDPGGLKTNAPPVARLSNIFPDDSSTINLYPSPRVTLYWVGDDPDGFVTAFRYRWSYDHAGSTIFRSWRTILNIAFPGQIVAEARTQNPARLPGLYQYLTTLTDSQRDSILTLLESWTAVIAGGDTIVRADSTQIQSPNTGTFIFESQDSLNRHLFQITAIDNDGVESIHPAQVSFWTPRASAPDTRFVDPLPADSSYVIARLTDTFQGIRFFFDARDAQSTSFEFSWSVDSVRWSPFSPASSATVTAADLAQPCTGNHYFYVKARNEFGVEDPTAARMRFYTIYPGFADSTLPKRILLWNNTRDSGQVACPRNQTLNRYYADIFDALGRGGTYDVWTVTTQLWPSRATFARYSVIVFYGDFNVLPLALRWSDPRIRQLRDYLDVGGKLIVSGWDFPYFFASGNDKTILFRDYIHAVPDTFTVTHDFVGATGSLGYPQISLDTTKLHPGWNGMLRPIPTCTPVGFAEIIYRYKSNSGNPTVHNRPVGVRFFGSPNTYSIVYFGLPLYYVPQSIAQEAIRKASLDVGE
jgi:hypothetical protein